MASSGPAASITSHDHAFFRARHLLDIIKGPTEGSVGAHGSRPSPGHLPPQCMGVCLAFLVVVVVQMSAPANTQPRLASGVELLDAKAALDGAVERLER